MTNHTHNHRTRLVIILGIATILSLSGDLTLYTILPVNAGGLPLTLAQIGVLLSANRFIRLLSNPVTGFLLDRGRRRPVFVYGMLLGTLSTLIYANTRLFGVLLFGRLVWGFAWSFINVGGSTMIVDSTGRGDRGRFMGILNLMVSLGLSINPLIGGLLADSLGFRPTMLFSALLTGAGFLLALTLLPETGPGTIRRTGLSDPQIRPLPSTPGLRTRIWKAIKSLRPRAVGWQIWLAVAITFIIFFSGNGLIMATIGRFISLEMRQGFVIGQTIIGVAALSGIILSLRSLLIALTSPMAGGFSDRRRTRWPTIMIGLGLGVAGMIALGTLSIIPAILLGITLTSLCEGVLLTVLPAIIGDQAAESQRGRSMGLIFVAGDLGSALAPMIAYSVLALIPLRQVYLASSGAFGLGLILVVAGLIYSRKRTSQNPPGVDNEI